ncbi:MAG: CHAT domain-containing protein, partial [Bacteroidota bacterium]
KLANYVFAAEILLRWDQVQGEESFYLQNLTRRSPDFTIRQLANQIRTVRTKLSLLFSQENANSEALRNSLDQLDELEVKLSRHSRSYKQYLSVREFKLNDVRFKLPSNSALIALKIYHPFDFKEKQLKSPHYIALLMPANRPIQLHDLGPIDKNIEILQSLKNDNVRIASSLYQKLFGDWDEQLSQYDSIYIIPGHWFHLFNFERLILPDGRHWIERQPLHRLQTARDLIRPAPEQQGKGVIAVGGINYGEHQNLQLASLDDSYRNLVGQLDNGFKPLKYSQKEVLQISEYFWHPNNNIQPTLLLGRNATEHHLKNLQHAPQILHLATHGFYLEDKQQLERPMILSGLALTGANAGIQGMKDQYGDDGILYAIEAIDLNLEGTQLVTLSACETGEGELDYSEGVYGLIRVFRIAGAQHILMTLRKVGDEAAFQFMSEFYFRWFENGMFENPAKALRETKLDFIRKGKPTDFWAPYVLVEMPNAS